VSVTAQPNPLPAAPKPDSTGRHVSLWVWAFRFLRWSTYLVALLTLILLLHKAPAPAVEVSPQAATSAEQKVQAVEQSISQGQQATLRLNESELNSYLASHLDMVGNAPNPDSTPSDTPGAPSASDVEQARSTVRDVKVQMADDRVKAYVVFDLHGKDMTLELEGRLAAQGGYLKFDPVSGHIGSLPIPQSTLQSAVSRLMESPDNREKLRLPPDIADLHIENGELVATYH
jgi:hypothetical protein